MDSRSRWITIPVLLASLVIAIDQLVKWMVDRQIGPGSSRHSLWLIGDWFGLSYAENSGIAFGLLRGQATMLLILTAFVVVLLIGAFVWSHRQSLHVLIAGGLIAGGAIGNLLDRIRFGYVRDFFAVGPWPSFNIADSAITIGVLIALIGSLKEESSSAGDSLGSLDVKPGNRRAFLETTD